MLHFLYHSVLGRIILKLLSAPWVSNLCGRFLDCKISCFLIPRFIKSAGIDMSEYEDADFNSFNEFFIRKIKAENRPVAEGADVLISPSDGNLTVYEINEEALFDIKNSTYSVGTLLKNDALAAEFDGGLCLVFRLCVDNYHRYHYIDNGTKGENVFIPGVLHTVQPVAFDNYMVFHENSREYSVMECEHLGKVVQVEVGAMLVGKIHNNMGAGSFAKGEEKGYFLYGGSTVIVLLKNGVAHIDDEIIKMNKSGKEYPVKMGQIIGKVANYQL